MFNVKLRRKRRKMGERIKGKKNKKKDEGWEKTGGNEREEMENEGKYERKGNEEKGKGREGEGTRRRGRGKGPIRCCDN